MNVETPKAALALLDLAAVSVCLSRSLLFFLSPAVSFLLFYDSLIALSICLPKQIALFFCKFSPFILFLGVFLNMKIWSNVHLLIITLRLCPIYIYIYFLTCIYISLSNFINKSVFNKQLNNIKCVNTFYFFLCYIALYVTQ